MMDLRLALYELAARHQLDARARHDLAQLAGLGREPAALAHWLTRGLALLAAALGGLGVICWIAANWEDFGRFGRFALLQGWFLALCAGALWRPAARVPLALLALLAIGALFAYFGQTYQTGADPWQLFALWAALALPLCCVVRSDVLWTPWALVAMGALALWLYARVGYGWQPTAAELPAHALAWCGALALIALLGPLARRATGAGLWPLRTVLTLSAMLITAGAFMALLRPAGGPQYLLGLLVLWALGATLAQPRWHDIVGLCAVGFGIDLLLLELVWHELAGAWYSAPIRVMLLLGLAAALLLAVTVNGILTLSRRLERNGGAA